ncbi:MAG: DDE-type integrase/transposase/recombinase [Gemmataceae bacterium]|nr:DDE-type integrase/transposase/recombinase [Gemmataceae bacterium]
MKQPSVYLKMRVLGAVDTVAGRTRHERVRTVAAMTFLDEEGHSRQFTWRTIQTWFYRYKNHGITGVTPQPRKDKGHTRKTTPEELLEAINAARTHFHNPRTNKRAIYRFCIENGLLQRDRIAQTTFYRFIREYDLLAPDDTDHKKRLAFSMKYANQLWQADTLFGPFCDTGLSPTSRKQTRLIAFIDDASRVLCHGQFFFEENVDTLVKALRSAFYKRGVPEQLLVDNGSIYCSQEITLICARVGCILRHTAVRDAAAKGKIERFFRRVRDQFLVQKLDLSSLEALNRQFTHWVEQDYNATPHDAIGMKPIDRFGIDLSRIRFLAPSEHHDELFYAEATRTVKKDNTFSFQGRRYETPADLHDQEIQLRHDRHHSDTTLSPAVVIYHRGQRIGPARLLDTVANGLLRRKEQP